MWERTVEYADRTQTLNFEPANISNLELLHRLHEGETTRVILEPGDATRYDLLIIPLNDQTSPTGVPGYEGWFGYVFLNNASRKQFLTLRPSTCWPMDFSGHIVNDWSRHVLSNFHNLLMEELDNA